MSTKRETRRRPSYYIRTPDRWVQSRFFRGRAYCLVGAIRHCEWLGYLTSHQINELLGATQRMAGYGYGGAALWNDCPGRTHAEVLAVLKRAEAEVLGEEA